MMARIRAALQRRRAAKAKARRIGEALRDLALLDLELRGRDEELEAAIARHPAGKQRKTGGDR